ncbi:MAG: TIGR04282 family arsenosugar biosynthesis glycosyltransferase [Salinimicrobium sp.]
MPQKKDLLLIFTRNPQLGKVKKRLAADIGDTSALKVYKFLLQHTFEVSKDLAVEKCIYYSEEIPQEDLWDKEIFQKKLQRGNGLGERMENAFSESFEAGYEKIVIIGSDLFDLQEEDLKKAFLALDTTNYVLGPASDGGYYLFGMKSLNSRVFRDKIWGSNTVLQETLQDLKNEQLTMLEVRNDIDYVQDLEAHPELRQIIKL